MVANATLRLTEPQQPKRIPFEVGAAHVEAMDVTAKPSDTQLYL